ncbi:LANO_0E02410g1_1 [Lachancea nothofagi CBS 11611]|uniref:LANO_0E02410g1_1 n=1 Tax=Lachancea nothofagi CBS 11611 TaxID=1266666 RepID=A0A1G4JQ35_9SACH|nr:LANO_0E02410g1_1 [Lachancea nothofagi CBS 11611]
MSFKSTWHLGKRLISDKPSSFQNRVSLQQYVLDPVKLIAIPITTRKVFLYHKHSSEILNVRSNIVKYETKLIGKASKIWTNLENSPRQFNRKLAGSINSLLDKAPWTEDSLNSIPSENYILKTVMENQEERTLTVDEWLKDAENLDIRPIYLYYPESVYSKAIVRQQLEALWTEGLHYHKKYTWLSILGIPLTLPLVLIPVMPNVPGFYLLYRAYRNYKAYCGAKHLKSLVENKNHKLIFANLPQYSDILKGQATATNPDAKGEEQLVLNEKDLDRILDTLEIHETRSFLRKAISQERQRLEEH